MNTVGEIKLYVGCMYAGKSDNVIRELKKWKPHPANVRCIMLKPAEDIRYSDTHVCTHDGVRYPAKSVATLAEIEDDLVQNYDVIGIDEGQFFPDLAEVVVRLADVHQKKVYVAALDTTWEREPWPQVVKLCPQATSVHKVHAICQRCGSSHGIFTQRTSGGTQLVEIGASNSYISVCRACFVQPESRPSQ